MRGIEAGKCYSRGSKRKEVVMRLDALQSSFSNLHDSKYDHEILELHYSVFPCPSSFGRKSPLP